MGRARDEAGNIWETDAQGKPVRLLTQAQGGTQMGQPDALRPVQVRQAEVGIPNTQENTRRTRVQTQGDIIDNQVKGATQQALIDKARAEAAKAAAEAIVAQRGANNPALSDDQRKAMMTRATLESIVPRLNRAQELYRQDVAPENAGNLFGLADMFTTPTTGRFDTVGEQISDLGLAAFRVPGVGAQSDYEAKAFAAANKPNTSNWDSSIEEKFANMRTRVDNNRRALGMQPAEWAGYGPNDPNLQPQGAAQALSIGRDTAMREAARLGKDPRAAAQRFMRSSTAKQLARKTGTWFGGGGEGGNIPTMTAEQAAKAPKGTRFRTTDGRVMVRQ